MILETKTFKETCKTILLAVDNKATNLELLGKESWLFLNIADQTSYISVKFALSEPATFRAVVDANLFLNLISGITADTFELDIKENVVVIKVGKSNYKLAMIYENDSLLTLPIIKIINKTVEMNINNDILKSITNVNSRELEKVKHLDVNELQRLYYVDETGCFTFTTGACLNEFKLEKPVKLLLTERVVKLFKLFNDNDVYFSFGHDITPSGVKQDKATFETESIYVAAIVPCDDTLLNKIQGPCTAAKNFINEVYSNHVVVSASSMLSAISRLIMFTKNSIAKANMHYMPVTITLHPGELVIKDRLENEEVVTMDNESSHIEDNYSMVINIVDLKLALESYKNEHITINCGNHKSVVICCGTVNCLIPEGRQA